MTISRSRWLRAALCSRMPRRAASHSAAALFGETPDDVGGGHAVQPELARVDFADALEQKFGGSLLGNNAAAALADGFDEIFFRISVGEHDHAGGWLGFLNRGEKLLARGELAGQPSSTMSGRSSRSLLDGGAERFGAADDVHIFLRRQQLRQAVPEKILIVRNQNTNRQAATGPAGTIDTSGEDGDAPLLISLDVRLLITF